MEFRVLGQLEAWRDGERLTLGSIKQRSLLALLVIHANQAVSTDQIIDELWGDAPAGDRHNALWIQVSKLRSALEPGRIPRSDGTVLTTRCPGYVLHVEPDHVDAYRFELLVGEARACAPSDPALSSLMLGEGLALWRGRAYEEFAYESFAQAEIGRLDELRVEAVELRLDADLRCGRAEELVAELQSLVHQHPLREHLSAQLMLALYRSGRRADALRAYGRLRRRLADELGLDPSAALRRLEQQIICGDAALDALAAPPSHPAPPAVRGYELREQIGVSALGLTYRAYQPSVGRELSLTVVSPELANDSTFIRRFQASADLANALRHPNLVEVDDVWREPGGTYVLTRLIAGGSLESSLQQGPLTLDGAVAIVGDVASAVGAAHQRGYVHGGIETGTVLVEGDRGFLYGFGFVPSGTTGGPTMAAGSDQGFNAPEQVIGGPLTPRTDVFRLGRVLERALRGVGAPGNTPPVDVPVAVADLIDQATALRPGDRLQDASAFAGALHDAVGSASASVPGADVPAVVDNPYMDSQAFGEVDAANFFGRERVVERLVARLGTNGTAGRFVALVGPSGCGKSSVVRAGLLPAIHRGAIPGSDDWFVVEITSRGRPFEELASGLSAIAIDPPVDLLDRLTDGRAGVRHVLHDVLPADQSQLVLVIDQFEEVFTHGGLPAAQPFLDALADAVLDRRSRLRLILTIREDFYDRPLSNHAFGELLREGAELLAAMSPEELQRAIERPAARAGVRFEPGLAAQIVADVADHTSALPLLQHALTELFDRRQHRVIELATYRELRGAAEALTHCADAVYGGLAPSERASLEASVDNRYAGQVAPRDQRARETRRQRRSRRRAAVLIGSSVALIAVSTVAASEVAHSRATDRLADASTQAHQLAVASRGVANKQPDLAMLLALQSLSTSAHQHLPALTEAEDALHWAVQGAGLTYPTSDAAVDARSGPNGRTGDFRLSLPALVELAREHLRRGFTTAECRHYSLHPCPASTSGLASPASTGAAPVPAAPPPTPAPTLARPLGQHHPDVARRRLG